MRRHLPLLFFAAILTLATVSTWASPGGGSITGSQVLPFSHDDRPITFGNTKAVPDASIKWDTTGADFLSITTTGPSIVLGNGTNAADVRIKGGTGGQQTSLGWYLGSDRLMVMGHDADNDHPFLGVAGDEADPSRDNLLVFANAAHFGKDFDHAATTDPTLFIHSDTDPDSDNTQWLSLSHNQTDAMITSGSGRMKFNPAGSGIVDVLDTDGDIALSFLSTVNTDAQIWFLANAKTGLVMTVADNFDQVTFATRGGGSSSGGRQIIITDYDNRAVDHGHAAATDPVLYVHSAYDPTESGAADTTQYVSLSHDQTDGHVGTGKGILKLSAGAGLGVRLPLIASADVSGTTCVAAKVGTVAYFDDTNDGGPGGFCGCIDAADGGAFAWVPLAASFTCPPPP